MLLGLSRVIEVIRVFTHRRDRTCSETRPVVRVIRVYGVIKVYRVISVIRVSGVIRIIRVYGVIRFIRVYRVITV